MGSSHGGQFWVDTFDRLNGVCQSCKCLLGLGFQHLETHEMLRKSVNLSAGLRTGFETIPHEFAQNLRDSQ